MKKIFKWMISGIIIGITVGILTFVFGTTLLFAIKISSYFSPYNLFFLPIIGFLTIYLKNKNPSKLTATMHQVFYSTKINNQLSIVILPFQFFLTIFSHFAGASVGREGVAVQLGAVFSNNLARVKYFQEIDIKKMTSVGKAAGFSGLFGTPLAGLFFAHRFKFVQTKDYSFWIMALISVFISSWTSEFLGLNHFKFNVETLKIQYDWLFILKMFIIIFSLIIVGNSFAIILNYLKKKNGNFKSHEYLQVIIVSLILGILLFVTKEGRYTSLGLNLIDQSFYKPEDIYYVDFIFKSLFTISFITIGFQGGEVTPLFAIGSSLGAMLALLLGMPVALIAALGYTLVFANASKAYLASFFLGISVFSITIGPYLIIALVLSKLFSFGTGIYPEISDGNSRQ